MPWAIGATVSAGALHAQGWGFESLIAHQKTMKPALGPASVFWWAMAPYSSGSMAAPSPFVRTASTTFVMPMDAVRAPMVMAYLRTTFTAIAEA